MISDGTMKEIHALEAKLQQAEAACASYRESLKRIVIHSSDYCASKESEAVLYDEEIGKGWLSPEKARVLTEALRLYHEAWNGEPADWRKAMCEASKNADQALAAVRKP